MQEKKVASRAAKLGLMADLGASLGAWVPASVVQSRDAPWTLGAWRTPVSGHRWVEADTPLLHSILEDVALLHGLGVRLVLVVGSTPCPSEQATLSTRPGHVDDEALERVIAAAGLMRMQVESRLRRSLGAEPEAGGVPTVSGNWVAARRLGILGGLDRGHAGAVRFVAAKSLVRQLDAGCLVLLDALGYSSGGEVLACDVYAVAARTAVDLRADKLVIWTLPAIMRGLRVGGVRDERAGGLPEGE
ncbi:hypothetical protein H632_c1545p0, partial [Helicosporidium sp. ATCC 50920]